MTDIACPGGIAHRLLTDRGVERLQDAADREVAATGTIASWPEHFEAAKAIETWECPKCLRLFIRAGGPAQDVIVYVRDRLRLPRDAIGMDSQLGNEKEMVDSALRDHAEESLLEADGNR